MAVAAVAVGAAGPVRAARAVVHCAAPAHLALAVADRLARRPLVPRGLDCQRLCRLRRVERSPVKEPPSLHRVLAVVVVVVVAVVVEVCWCVCISVKIINVGKKNGKK